MRFNLERPDMRKVLAGTQLGIERAVTSGILVKPMTNLVFKDILKAAASDGQYPGRRAMIRRNRTVCAKAIGPKAAGAPIDNDDVRGTHIRIQF